MHRSYTPVRAVAVSANRKTGSRPGELGSATGDQPAAAVEILLLAEALERGVDGDAVDDSGAGVC